MLTPGTRLGPYEITGVIGAGGMGEVYRARDPRLGRDVAIKVLSTPSPDQPTQDSAAEARERLRRFEQEARAVAGISHPNILAIFDVGTGEAPYLVTELLEGETLRRVIERGPVAVARAIDLALQLVAGLSAAHARGVIHRDLKPENLFVTSRGDLKILDFGLARQTRPLAEADATITAAAQTIRGTVMGTLGYMAPEQLRGFAVDARADLFAAGAILYEMLTGRRAFRGETPADTISSVLNDPPSALVFGPAPPALEHIVRRCLQKNAADRFQSVQELGTALESISDVRVVPSAVSAGPAHSSIAVLPFANLSADPANQYFSDGLAEELITALARLSGLKVASGTSSFRFRGRDLDIRQIGRELGVAAILEGSVRRSGTRLRVTAQLTDTADGYHIWSDRYDREITDVFEIQDEIVESIVKALAPALLGEARNAVRRPTENLQAYELYLKGRYFWNQRSPLVMGTAIRCFEDAIALDPGYALAYTGLADCYSILRVYGWTPAEHSQPRALSAVTEALALDPNLREAHFSKALYTFHFERHWRAARDHFLWAASMGPPAAMFEAYFGLFLATEYDYAGARERLDRALDLDPHSAVVHFLAGAAACAMGDADSACRHAVTALELQPESMGARWPQTVGLIIAGRFDEALAVGEQVIARSRAPVYVGVLGMLYGRAGRLADARRLARELDERESRGEYIFPAARLAVYLGLDDDDGIRTWLAACADGGAAPFSVVATCRVLLDARRGDPEVDRLLDRLHDGAGRTTDQA